MINNKIEKNIMKEVEYISDMMKNLKNENKDKFYKLKNFLEISLEIKKTEI